MRFTAQGPFRPAKACHCKTCRRQSGHYLAATRILRGGLTVEGEGALSWYRASPEAQRGFCKTCGAHLFWRREADEGISIFMGCLDEPTGLQLADHIFVIEKGDYYEICDDLPKADRA